MSSGELDRALDEMTSSAVHGALPRVFDPAVLELLRSRYRKGLEQNVKPGEWPAVRGGALQASWALGSIASQVAVLHDEFVIDKAASQVAVTVVETECELTNVRGRVCLGLQPLPPGGNPGAVERR